MHTNESPKLKKLAAVIGDPISHSLSPHIHNHWLKQLNIHGGYDAKHISSEQLGPAIEEMKEEGYLGFNVTLPHKETILEYIDEVEETAEIIGAVNTVIIQNNKLLGFNTDAYGFWQNLKTYTKNEAALLEKVIIVGAGGAARACLFALKKAGATNIHIVARSPEKALSLNEISNEISIHPLLDLNTHLKDASLLINTTPLGMKGSEDYQWDLNNLPLGATVTDIVYNPLHTALLKAANKRGNPTIDGLGMLIFQAIPGFEAWFGARPDMNKDTLDTLKQRLIESCNLLA